MRRSVVTLPFTELAQGKPSVQASAALEPVKQIDEPGFGGTGVRVQPDPEGAMQRRRSTYQEGAVKQMRSRWRILFNSADAAQSVRGSAGSNITSQSLKAPMYGLARNVNNNGTKAQMVRKVCCAAGLPLRSRKYTMHAARADNSC